MHIQHHPLPHVFDSAFQSLVSCDVTPCGPPCTDGALTSCSFLTFFFTVSSVFQRRHYSRSWNMISFCFFVSPLFPHLLPSVATYQWPSISPVSILSQTCALFTSFIPLLCNLKYVSFLIYPVLMKRL